MTKDEAEEKLTSAIRDFYIADGTEEEATELVERESRFYRDFIEENTTSDAEKAREDLDSYIEDHIEELDEEEEA